MNTDLILRSRARFAWRLEGWQRESCPDGSRRAPDSARALPNALLTMREWGMASEKRLETAQARLLTMRN
jgi:hypothetical protein